MSVENPPPHVQAIVDSYRWRGEKPAVFTFELSRREAYVVLGATTLTLTEAQPTAVTEVLVLAHLVGLSTTKGTVQLTPAAGPVRLLSQVNEAELLGAILDRLQPPLPR